MQSYYFFCTFAKKMVFILKKRCFLYVFLAWITCLLTGCNDLQHSAARLQKELNLQEQRATDLTEQLADALQSDNFDSLLLVSRKDESVAFYVYDYDGSLLYWSQNWLSVSHVFPTNFKTWEYRLLDNAHSICRWTNVGRYMVLTVIPIKYNYSIQNSQLHNNFLPTFSVNPKWGLSREKHDEACRIYSTAGDYLFSLEEQSVATKTKSDDSRLAASFSYQGVLNTDENTSNMRVQLHIYIVLSACLVILLLFWGVFGVVRSGGWSNLLLSRKFAYSIVLVLLFSFGYVFLVSTRFTLSTYRQRQRADLMEKTRYIQRSLQDLYYFRTSLNELTAYSINVDLRDLCFAYETDINVFDAHGNLVGSSSPALYERGLVAPRMLSEAFFSPMALRDTIFEEQIGDMHYLSAYAELMNGYNVPIGYISVPSYVSTDKVQAELDDFLARMFPYYLLVMMVSIFIAFALSRGITHPLNTLSERLMDLKIGRHNAHLDYHKKDELGRLVEKYNEMVDQLEDSADKLARSEREGAWRTMARQIAHEINNPLTPMRLSIQQMQRLKRSNDPRFDSFFDHSTDVLVEQIDALNRIATSFSSFAKMPEVSTSQVDVAEKLYSVIQLFRNNQEHVPIRYVGAEHGVMCVTDEGQIGQVFNNLIKNALQAIGTRENGDIIVMLKEFADRVEISVSDNGSGIDDDVRERIFVPNFTTKSTGTGLGLAISKNIVDGSGGKIWFDTSSKGTTFFVLLKK